MSGEKIINPEIINGNIFNLYKPDKEVPTDDILQEAAAAIQNDPIIRSKYIEFREKSFDRGMELLSSVAIRNAVHKLYKSAGTESLNEKVIASLSKKFIQDLGSII